MNQQAMYVDAKVEAVLCRALELESAKTIELGAIRSRISTLEIHRTLGVPKPPGLDDLRATAQVLERDLKALRAFQADHPCYRLEKAGGLLGNFA